VTLSLIIAVLVAWWLVTVALATGAFKVRRHRPRHHDEEGEHQH
jgi:heme/copper-type cytochrome/quinol oxidase subunit 2